LSCDAALKCFKALGQEAFYNLGVLLCSVTVEALYAASKVVPLCGLFEIYKAELGNERQSWKDLPLSPCAVL